MAERAPGRSRPGDLMLPDPRVRRHGNQVVGVRCANCGYVSAHVTPVCPECWSRELPDTLFGPHAHVYASTTVRIPVDGRTPPYGLAYADVVDGPRILVQVAATAMPAIGGCLRIVADDGADLKAEPATSCAAES